MVDIDDFKEFYANTFGSKANQILSEADQKRLAAIVKYLEQSNDLTAVNVVEVVGARVPVEIVEAHGLEISLDANRNAVHVSTPYGFYTDGA